MKRKILMYAGVMMLLVLVLCGTFVSDAYGGARIFTGSGSSSSGGGGSLSGCDGSNNDRWYVGCTGTSWIYYKASAETTEEVTLPYANITGGGAVRGSVPAECSVNGGGFWHFGINARGADFVGNEVYTSSSRSYGHLVTVNWGYYTSRDWVPYKTEEPLKQSFGVYVADHFGSEATVLSAYKEALKADEDTDMTDEEIDNITGLPNLLWGFCYWEDGQPSVYKGQSAVYNSGSNSWAATEINTTKNSPAKDAATATVEVGEIVGITFLHNPYASESSEDVPWQVTRSGNGFSDASVTAVNEDATYSGSEDLTEEISERLFTVEDRDEYDGSENLYLLSNSYLFSFTAAGEYQFCETLAVDESEKTYVCTKVKVSEPEISENSCPATWTPESYKQSGVLAGGTMVGTTSVLNKIKNNSLTERALSQGYSYEYISWRDQLTYAMPTDNITWIDCYYPGVQKMANEKVSTSDSEPYYSNSSTNPVVYTTYFKTKTNKTWTNEFSVESNTNSKNKIFNAPTEVLPAFNVELAPPIKTSDELSRTLSAKITVGDGTSRSTTNDYGIKKADDAGKTYREIIKTPGTPYYASISFSTHKWGCCGKRCRACRRHTESFHGYNYASGITPSYRELSDQAEVRVPYNFINTTHFTLTPPQGNVVYAGETVKVSDSYVNVGVRENKVTAATYTTQVDDAKVRLISYVTDEDGKKIDEAKTVGHSGQVLDANAKGQIVGNTESDLCDFVSYNRKTSGMCTVNREERGVVLNKNGELNGTSDERGQIYNGTYNVFDASAGDYYCMVMAVYPAMSGWVNDDSETAGDRNMDANGVKQWYISAPQCYKIAKRPSFVVYGGDLFSNGNINTSVSVKRNIYGFSPYNFGGGNVDADYRINSQGNDWGATIFGSWVEQGVVANGNVRLLASGAGVGYDKSNDDKHPGMGSWEGADPSFCKNRTALSFANYDAGLVSEMICPYVEMTGEAKMDVQQVSTNGAGVASNTTDRESLALNWLTDVEAGDIPDQVDGATVTIGDISNFKIASSATGKGIYYTYGDGNLTLEGGTVEKNTTYVIRAKKNVTIKSDIKYSSSELSAAGEIPKVVIYAGGDVAVECDVWQLDAIVIAEGEVNSCSNASEDINDVRRSHQLVVRGMIIANKIVLGRTYGNAAGNAQNRNAITPAEERAGSSITPAEAINYDTSAIVWGRYMAGSAESDTLTETYRQELAPRY